MPNKNSLNGTRGTGNGSFLGEAAAMHHSMLHLLKAVMGHKRWSALIIRAVATGGKAEIA